MGYAGRVKTVVATLALVAGLGVLAIGLVSCAGAPTSFPVNGSRTLGNEEPTLTILEPVANITRSQGDPFLIRWADSDRDDAAKIRFTLVSTTTNNVILLTEGVEENDTIGPDQLPIPTSIVPIGTYNLLGTISDGVNPPVDSFALVAGGSTNQRVIVTIVGPGEGPQTVPPSVAVTEPVFNRSVSQDDILTIRVQPTLFAPDPSLPFDPDSNVRLFIVLDVDDDPNNDDPANPVADQIIVLEEQIVLAGSFEEIAFEKKIDLSQIPPRPDGEPYFIRATVFDGTNPRVHQYATGTISVVQLAAGIVDLFDIGRTKSGAKFQGFNPGANLGSRISSISDFDADGVDDFVMVARFGNPQNVGLVGEAYLLYGQGRFSSTGAPIAGDRFGGTISVNSISDTISGVVFQGPPVRDAVIPDPNARTEGITDVSFVRDLSGDGRPELLFGLPHVHGAIEAADYDPEDSAIFLLGCYPDPYVNNLTFDEPDPDLYWYGGGMAVIVNSSNRDIAGQNINALRLESTSIALELVGQRSDPPLILSTAGESPAGSIFSRADAANQAADRGDDPPDELRIAGARFIAGGFDFIATQFFLDADLPREGMFGATVRSLGDLTNDDLDEIIISSPRNERYLRDLGLTGFFNTHLASTIFVGSITIVPGNNYNDPFWREKGGGEGSSSIPWPDNGFGRCTGVPERRRLFIPADSFEIFAEDIDDWLGQGQSAGDVNQDGIDDILCGAPRNDLNSSRPNTGAAYIIYGRPNFGEVDLRNASDISLRAPMLRIRGVKTNDQIGWSQSSGLDVNGDRKGDVFIASPHADFGDVIRDTCATDVNGDLIITQADLTLRSFEGCRATDGTEVFENSACDAFDYDNDGDIDDDDLCIFCCLSDDCAPSSDCVLGTVQGACCENLVDNGYVGIIFGGVTLNGDRDITQLASSQLPGTIFFGAHALDRAGTDVSSAGDFNKDGFGDILITAPGEERLDSAGRLRIGVVYLIFGGTHLENTTWSLDQVGTDALPGIVFLSPYVRGNPNEAAPLFVASIGDINLDGFDDIAIGNPRADFIDQSFPQGPNAPGDDPSTGRRRNVGDVYVVYGNNFGPNRAIP